MVVRDGMTAADMPGRAPGDSIGFFFPDRSGYLSAQPWPHLVVDGIFAPDLIADAESQELPAALAMPEHRSHRQVKAESPQVSGPAAGRILAHLISPDFVGTLAEVAGIDDLRADPTLFWGGIHVGRSGAFQAIHRDFPKHPLTGCYHRLTALVYLSADWTDDYGGDLELWTSDLQRCERRIAPRAGRLVVLDVSSAALHRVDNVRCPAGKARLALVAQYYSDMPPADNERVPLLRRPRRPQDPWRISVAGPADAMTVVRRGVSTLRSVATRQR